MVGYDIFKIWEELFRLKEEQNNMLVEDIQREDLCKICSVSADKKTLGIDTEKKLNKVYRAKYRMDHQILSDHSVF